VEGVRASAYILLCTKHTPKLMEVAHELARHPELARMTPLQKPDVREAITMYFENALLPNDPRLWILLVRVDLHDRPLAALDVLVNCFETDWRVGDHLLFPIASDVLRSPHLDPDARVMVTSAVSKGVIGILRTTPSAGTAGIVRESVLDAAVAAQLWDYAPFRTHDGIPYLIAWIPYVRSGRLTFLVAQLLRAHPDLVLHSPNLAATIVSTIASFAPGNDMSVLTELFATHPGACLVLMARVTCPTFFRGACARLRDSILPPEVWAGVQASWSERLSDAVAPVEESTTAHVCPITLAPMVRPCLASDGFTYEQSAIMDVLARNMTSPMTREILDVRVIPNTTA